MRAPSREARYGAFGVATGLAAVAAGRCAGGACLSCVAGAIPGAAAVLLAALGSLRRSGGAPDAEPGAGERLPAAPPVAVIAGDPPT